MKIITWNCNGAFRKKYHLLEDFSADILVIQECEDPAQIGGEYLEWATNHLWVGNNKHKGLGVFARPHITLSTLSWQHENARLFLPCHANKAFNLLAVWTKNAPDYPYIGQLWHYLQQHKNALYTLPTIICGDLNSNTCWDQSGRVWNHSNVVRELEEIGLYSAYHLLQNEAQGRESKPTLYMQRNLEKPYHIDYIFMPKSLLENGSNITIGEPIAWLEHSDHMPVIIDF